jgi:hypothetical protein
MCLGFIGLMTGPLLIVLHTMPLGLFGGVFFVVGWGGIPGFNTTQNILYCMSEKRFVEPGDPRNTLKKWRILYFTSFQLIGVAISVAISQTIAAIGFPVVIMALIPLRWCVLPRIFTEHELMVLDSPTADSDTVLCSMGGQPERPEVTMAKKRRAQQGGDGETGATSSGASTKASNGGTARSRDAFKDDEELAAEDREKQMDHKGIQSTLNTGHN